MDIEIRTATTFDAERIHCYLEKIAELHSVGRADIFKKGSKYKIEDLVTIIEAQSKIIFVAEFEQLVIGYIICEIHEKKDHALLCDRKFLYIDDLFVDENIRGKQVGKQLMDKALSCAKENSCSSVELNVWEFNTGAMAFYEKYGMRTQRRILELSI